METRNIELNIPQQIENLQLPDPELLTYYQNLEKRIVWLDCAIDEASLDLVKRIMQWNKEDKNQDNPLPIKIFFFSPGGDLEVNNALIDAITLSDTPVYGYNIGKCYSAAAYIFLSCHRRFCMPRAQFLLHQGSGEFVGTYSEILPQVMAYQEQISHLAQFVAERTSYTEEEIAKNITSDWYITAEEGLAHGIYTDKISSLKQLV